MTQARDHLKPHWRELVKNAQPITWDDIELWRKESNLKSTTENRSDEINQKTQTTPRRFQSKTFDDFKIENEKQAHVKKIVMRYVDTFKERVTEGTPVIFKGSPRTGKTLLSRIVEQSLTARGFRIKYESSLEFIKNLLEIKFKSQSFFDNEIEMLKRFHLLIIDRVTESINKDTKPSEIEKQVLFKIINDRYEHHLCTLVITHHDTNEMIERLGEPIIDRLTEKGITLAFNWNSYRQK